MDEKQIFAERYNVSNPRKWEERQVLLPNVLCAPRKLTEHVGYYDARYYYGEFGDDDFSFKIRRAGYKLVFCNDTFAYHFGHVTTEVEHKENSSLQVSRKWFFQKWGLDAWDDARMNMNLCGKIDVSWGNGDKNMLAINTRCGCTPQMVANRYREATGFRYIIHGWSDKQKYEADLKSICETVRGTWETSFSGTYEKGSMDSIMIGDLPFMDSERLLTFFCELRSILKPDGQLALTAANTGNYVTLAQAIYESDIPG